MFIFIYSTIKVIILSMDEDVKVVDLTKHFETDKTSKKASQVKSSALHSNPIFKQLFALHAADKKHKFSLKDLFR